jgi:hypothetical protein
MRTEPNKYKPTAVELKLLKVLENPEFATSSVTDICKQAGISRTAYYESMAKPDFVAYIKDTAIEMVKKELYPLWQAAIGHAKAGNYQYWKAIMDATGQYQEKQKHEVVATIQHSDMTTEEIERQIAELMGK